MKPNAFDLLKEIRLSKETEDIHGNKVPYITESLEPEEGQLLYNLVRERRPQDIIEVGMERATSTLHLLQGVADNGSGIVVSIDPLQYSHAKGVGVRHIQRAGLTDWHKHIEDYSEFILPQLLKNSCTCDLTFIDSNHRFDQTILECFYLDKMLKIGGVMILHDMWMMSLIAAVSFLQTNLEYRAIPSNCKQVKVLEKTKEDQRRWDYFVPFEMPQKNNL